MPDIKMMKQKWYPRPHNRDFSYTHGLESAAVDQVTIYPVIMYDEGLGAPFAYDANPEHAGFLETDAPNCYPDSRVDNIICKCTFTLTKAAIETDKVVAVKGSYMPIFTSFLENITALDEVSGLTVGTILELQTESTDRQCYPLYNTVKMDEKFTGSGTLPAIMPGLT